MHFFRLASVFSLALVAVAQDISIRAVKRAFNAANIPNDLDIVFRPTALLEVSLPQAAGAPITLHAGIQVPRNDTAGPPVFRVVGDVGHGPFVVATVDPDAPTPQAPTEAQIRHFLGGNFFNEGGRLVNSTPAISEFLQPTPPAGSDAHRYIFLLFDQSPQFAHQTLVNATTSIALFNISQFASAADLGNPLAGTFMLVAPEPDA
ncbi:PEBP-like protein [Mycena albidolilacea]|uniref:PEBP-like protein n=1 Tax=Mycena albidolilacea TaxID=1033008 RepID=A0AAD7EE26_9AGAR|nr:PEBP-like protein [Mycena albidolilacea]